MKRILMNTLIASFLAVFAFAQVNQAKTTSKPASATGGKLTKCHMDFSLKSWSFIYKSDKGTGRITCDNGQSANVKIRAHSGGPTVGKSRIDNGHGVFTEVRDIRELYGSYASGEAHGGVGESGRAQGLTKGDISLSLTGTGKGVDVGLAFGSFKISPRGK